MVSYRCSLQENMFLHFSWRFSANPWHILEHNSHSCTQAIDSEADDQQPKDATSKASHGEIHAEIDQAWTRPGKRLHNELERSTMLFLWENSIFRLGHWNNSYFDITRPGIGFLKPSVD